MKLENNEFQDAESYLSLAIKIDPNFIKDKKYFLMQALILCGQNKVDESITIFESLLVNPITKATLLMGLIKMFIGIMYRENDDYQKSEFYFNKAKFDLMKDKYYYSILLSNYGNLYHVKEDYDNAILFYNKAISILSKLAEWDAVSALYSNLSNVMYDRFYLNDKAENKGWEYFRESVRLKQKKDYEMILNYKYNGLINYLYELFSLASKSKSKLSYNYTDAFNYLKNSENLCKNLGDYSGRKNVKYLSAISTFLLGKETNQKELFHSSLCNFILNCSKEGIEAIAEHGFNYLNEFIDILHWTFTFKGDRNALNGRLIFYKEFSDYIPEVDIPKVFEILCTFESKEYSLWSSHDYGRNSIEVLKKTH
ncbi:MAG: Tetratricopeptide repeat protein [Chlorobi bacterium OLB5]|nr:MAG: Tetratricopeptide repeat protein [Chlorobi bacterium OLB5]